MIRQAGRGDSAALALLALQLWSNDTFDELKSEFERLSESEDAACFLKYAGEKPVGFAQCQLRRDYVEGTETSPVGYLEGIYVREDDRRQGIARSLLSACESWAKAKGCTEFASDCELDNADSLRFHLAAGFEETNRIICFKKDL
jgi:aminoglycoside 6'-N-acetyltransferase I